MIHILCSGVLLSAPQQRTGGSGKTFCTGLLKSSGKDGDALVSFISFAEVAQTELLALAAGDAVALQGVGKLSSWTGKDGTEKHGLSIVVDKLLPHKPQPKAAKPKPKSQSNTWQKPGPAPAMAEGEAFDDAIPF